MCIEENSCPAGTHRSSFLNKQADLLGGHIRINVELEILTDPHILGLSLVNHSAPLSHLKAAGVGGEGGADTVQLPHGFCPVGLPWAARPQSKRQRPSALGPAPPIQQLRRTASRCPLSLSAIRGVCSAGSPGDDPRSLPLEQMGSQCQQPPLGDRDAENRAVSQPPAGLQHRGMGEEAANKIRKEAAVTGKLPRILSPRDLAPGSAWAGVGCWGGRLGACSVLFTGARPLAVALGWAGARGLPAPCSQRATRPAGVLSARDGRACAAAEPVRWGTCGSAMARGNASAPPPTP